MPEIHSIFLLLSFKTKCKIYIWISFIKIYHICFNSEQLFYFSPADFTSAVSRSHLFGIAYRNEKADTFTLQSLCFNISVLKIGNNSFPVLDNSINNHINVDKRIRMRFHWYTFQDDPSWDDEIHRKYWC